MKVKRCLYCVGLQFGSLSPSSVGLHVWHCRGGQLSALKNDTTAFIALLKKLKIPLLPVVSAANTLPTKQVDNNIAHRIAFIFFILVFL